MALPATVLVLFSFLRMVFWDDVQQMGESEIKGGVMQEGLAVRRYLAV
jgi:hypothetical protein